MGTRRLPIWALLVALSLLTAAPALSEDAPSVDDLVARSREVRSQQAQLVKKLLADGDRVAQAWGAYLAAEYGVREATGRLLELYDKNAHCGPWPWALSLLDALVRLDASIEGTRNTATLTRSAREGDAAALALLVRGGGESAQLAAFEALDGDDRSKQEAWLALGNTLAASKAQGFVARALAHLAVRVEVRVHDELHGGGGLAFGMSTGCGRVDVPKGYPPLFTYRLTLYPGPSCDLLAPGRRSVYLERNEIQPWCCSTRSHRTGDRDEDRRAWLASVLGRSGDQFPKAPAGAWVEWTEPSAYLTAAEAARTRAIGEWWDLARDLVNDRVLDDAAARALRPRVDVEIRDDRKDKAMPLPTLLPCPESDLACPWPTPSK